MPPRTIDLNDSMGVFGHMTTDFCKMKVHSVCVGIGQDKSHTCIACGADSTEDVGTFVSLIEWPARPRASSGPDAGQRTFLSDTSFVLEPEFDRFAFGVFGEDFFDFCGEVFLKSSWATASASQ